MTTSTPTYTDFVTHFGLDYKQHQEDCVNWCVKNEQKSNNKQHGGLIADEMGLGKTYQTLALLYANPLPNTLIIVPVALLEQWEAALKEWTTKETNIIIYRGYARKKITEDMLASSVCLTTYGEISTLFEPNKRINKHNKQQKQKQQKQKTQEDFASPIHRMEWQRIVFDEAHHLRNRKTMAAMAAVTLRSKIKWLLTGTPIQNSRQDFYSLCEVIGIPPMLYTGDTMDLKTLTKEYIIKRTKKELKIPMPELQEQDITVSWTNPTEAKVAAMLHSRIGMGTREDKLPMFSDYRIVDYMRARQMCVLPRLLTPVIKQQEEQQQEDDHQQEEDEAAALSANTTPVQCRSLTLLRNAMEGSSKLNAVVETIKSRRTEGRKLVFCEFRQEMDFLEAELQSAGIKTARIDGRTTKAAKTAIIQSTSIEVLILQVKTCSEGLNLQQYNEVYIVTPQWNPCTELQAVCRCYRIGQTTDVTVFRFKMDDNTSQGFKGNMETHVRNIQTVKLEIAKELHQE
jgi:SNF2 family DNA or RNA helicase